MPSNLVVREAARSRRRLRMPNHSFFSVQKMWEIAPVVIAPVLPGETMKQALIQIDSYSDPVGSTIVGCWQEFYLFYVKLTDLDGHADFREMFLDTEKDMSAYEASATDVDFMVQINDFNPLQYCYERVVETWFRNEGEAWNNYTGDNGFSMASINVRSWHESIIDATDIDAYDIDLTDIGSAGGAAVTASEIEDVMRTWEFMRHQKMTQMSYEDFVRSYGVQMPSQEEERRPELLRFVKRFAKPVASVEPSTGVPSSLYQYAVNETADKDRFFREPGFILGLNLYRPKVYLEGVNSYGATMLNNVKYWLPTLLNDDPATSLREYAAGAGPIRGTTNGYSIDVKDLYLNGEMFANVGLAGSPLIPSVDLPQADGNIRYPSNADGEGLFTTALDDDWRADGIVQFRIMSSAVDGDTTPSPQVIG